MNFELNNVQRDRAYDTSKITKNSPVAETFAAWVTDENFSRIAPEKVEASKSYIMGLGAKAMNGDSMAVAELNTLRRITIEEETLKAITLMSRVFGSTTNLGFDETIEREIVKHTGERAREQALNGDVVFPVITKERYLVPTFTISAGYAVDYRRVSLGDMSLERKGIEEVKITMLNMAKRRILNEVVKAVKAAKGVKYVAESAGLTKAVIDKILNDMRPFGRLSMIGDYALVSQLNNFAGYTAEVGAATVLGISERIMNQIQDTGFVAAYNGVIISEMENPYDTTQINAAGGFDTLLPRGLGFVLPNGNESPVATWTRGGITTLTGNDVKTGQIITRFDLEMAVDVARGHEYKIGMVIDTNLGGLE